MGRFEDSRYIRIELLYTKWWFFSFLSFWFHHNLLALLVKYHLLTRIKFMYVCVRMNSKFLCCWDKTKNYCCVLTWFRLPIYNTSITNKCLFFQKKKTSRRCLRHHQNNIERDSETKKNYEFNLSRCDLS